MKYKAHSLIKLLGFLLTASYAGTVFADEDEHKIKQSFRNLSSHQQLTWYLKKISKWSHKGVNAGPLIINDNNGGVLNIDTPLNPYLPINTAVCGDAIATPTIREAVTCTVNDGLGGNTDKNNIGFSTQGRELLAASLGNPAGTRVMIITQQHGNEPAATEAAMKVLAWLSFSHRSSIDTILDKLNILMLIRANPDGGEPNVKRCDINPATGSVITKDCAMIRENVNPYAGGGFAANSEAGFSGVVGHGYDLNRYHFVNLQSPIRPQETQAMVAAALAFNPEVILDLHGDLHKTDCQINPFSINPGQVLGQLPTAECFAPDNAEDTRLISPFADAIFSAEKEYLAQSLAVNVMEKVSQQFKGSVGRFSQIQLGNSDLSVGSPANYQLIGAVSAGWETINFSTKLRADVVAVENYQPVMGVNSGLPDPAILNKQININRVALVEALLSLAEFKDNAPTDGNGFCDYPLAAGLQAELSPELWGPAATNGEVIIPMSPLLGIPQIISGNCP